MKKLATKFWHWLTFPNRLLVELERERQLSDMAVERCSAAQEWAKLLEAQLIQTRVSQSRIGRAGWEVMCFIPEEVLNRIRVCPDSANSRTLIGLIEQVVTKQVTQALAGINRVDAQGKVTALIFAPLSLHSPADEPRYVQAVFEKDGQYKAHEKLWDGRSEEQRVKSAAGCGGFGV